MSSRIARIGLLVTVIALGAWVGTTPAGAASLGFTVSPTTAVPGQDFTVSGDPDCIQGSTLTVAIVGLDLSQTVSGDAAWELTFTVPDTAAIGTYPVTISGQECNYGAGSITVAAPTTTTVAPTTLAPTTTAPAAAAAAVAAAPAFTG